MCDLYIIDAKGTSSISCISKDSYIRHRLMHGREGRSIIQHRLFDGFSQEVSGPSGFFFFLRPFCGPSLPLLILLTLTHQSNSERFGVQVCFRHTSVLNGVCVCVLREQQESSCRALGITHRGVLGNVCVSEEQASRKLETHKSHLI